MLGSHNILNPANGSPITVPSQDMVLGLYYMTKSRKSSESHELKGEGLTFYSPEEVNMAYNEKIVDLNAIIKCKIKTSESDDSYEIIETTPGRIFFNEGKDYLSSRLDAVYTRANNDPEYAIKFFNRGEKHSYFFLDAKDRNTPLIVPGEQRSYSALLGESNSNIFSYNYNLGKGQNLGFLATNRTYEEGGFGRLYSAKGKFLLSDKYSIYFEDLSYKEIFYDDKFTLEKKYDFKDKDSLRSDSITRLICRFT